MHVPIQPILYNLGVNNISSRFLPQIRKICQLLKPLIYRKSHTITPKCHNSLETNFTKQSLQKKWVCECMHVLILTTCKIQLSFMYTHTTMVKLLLSTSEKNSLHQNQHQTSPWGSFSFLNKVHSTFCLLTLKSPIFFILLGIYRVQPKIMWVFCK